MKFWIRKSVGVGLLAGGLLLVASPSQAQAVPSGGLVSGNSVSVPVSVAANVCGTGIGVLGKGVGYSKECEAKVVNKTKQQRGLPEDGIPMAAPGGGLVSGNKVSVPVSVAANVCGTGIGVLGKGVGYSKECEAKVVNIERPVATDGPAPASRGLVSGNSVSVPVSVAANVCGTGIGVLGKGVGYSKECEAKVVNKGGDGETPPPVWQR